MDKALKARLDKLDKIRKDLQSEEKTTSKEIMEVLKKMMADNPLIVGVRWRQYTPSFNDGEPCEFTVDGPYIKFVDKVSGAGDKVSDQDNEDGEGGGGYLSTDYEIDKDFFEKRADIFNFKDMKTLKKTVKDVCAVYSSLMDMDRPLIDMFGVGTEITVTKDGVETEDYDCGQ